MPELVYHGDSDGGLSKILNQKAATPQKIYQEAKDAFTDHRPNIISLQRSTYQEHDDSIVKANAWDALAQKIEQCARHNYHGIKLCFREKLNKSRMLYAVWTGVKDGTASIRILLPHVLKSWHGANQIPILGFWEEQLLAPNG